MNEVQGSFEDTSPEYSDFLDKFKPKKTTDDCYTPAPVYETVIAQIYNADCVTERKPLQ